MKTPKITVCIPAYNAQAYLAPCLNSLSMQTFKNFRIEFVDDASTDNTLRIIKKFCKSTDIKCDVHVHKTNSGSMGLGVQESLNRCKSPFFMWMAADDEIDPTYLEELSTILELNKDFDYVYTDTTLINEQSVPVDKWIYPTVTYNSLLAHVLKTQSGILPMVGMFRTSFFQENKIQFELPRGEGFSSDTLNSLHFMEKGMSAYKLSKPLFKYRKHMSQGSKDAQKRILSDLKVLTHIFLDHTKGLSELDSVSLDTFLKYVKTSTRNNSKRFTLKEKELFAILDSEEYQATLKSSCNEILMLLIEAQKSQISKL